MISRFSRLQCRAARPQQNRASISKHPKTPKSRGHPMASAEGLNRSSQHVFQSAQQNSESLSIAYSQLPCGAHLLDFGVAVRGGLQAGVQLASICLGGLADISISSGDRSVWRGPWVRVSTDYPVRACLFGQYAGWPVQVQSSSQWAPDLCGFCEAKRKCLKS